MIGVRISPNYLFAGALALLLCNSIFAGYRWYMLPRVQAAHGLDAIGDILRAEANATTTPLRQSGTTAPSTIPDMLGRIQAAGSDSGLTIDSVTINPVDPKKLTFGVQADFRGMMLFFARLEAFHLHLDGYQLEPDQSVVKGKVDVTFAPELGGSSNFADYMDAMLKYSALRDPFDRGDPVPLPDSGPELGDLSWTYHLTSISQVGAERIATIDGKDYRPGDKLNGLEIIGIDPSGVRLRSAKDLLIQKLHFRRNAEGATE